MMILRSSQYRFSVVSNSRIASKRFRSPSDRFSGIGISVEGKRSLLSLRCAISNALFIFLGIDDAISIEGLGFRFESSELDDKKLFKGELLNCEGEPDITSPKGSSNTLTSAWYESNDLGETRFSVRKVQGTSPLFPA